MNETRLKNLARLAVRKGVGLRPGQKILIRSAVEPEMVRLARACAEEAWKAGAKEVLMDWSDPQIQKMFYQNASEEVLESISSWEADKLNQLAEEGACFLHIDGEDPDLLAEVSPGRIQKRRRALNRMIRPYRKKMDSAQLAWTIVAAPSAGWAAKVYPDLEPDEAVEKLWEDIFAISRVDENDPLPAWEQHGRSFASRIEKLNGLDLKTLHYTSSNGTDLWIELPEQTMFVGGSSVLQNGQEIFCNIPTEEIFAAPRLDGVNGKVQAVLPLSLNGQIVQDFGFVFEKGRVTDYWAKEGKEALEALFESAADADRLGEVALVDKSSPIRQSGKIFFNTLFDENAACHLAFGQSYAETIRDGIYMDEEQLKSRGMNQSQIHVDFMIGADDLRIEGITRTNRPVLIFENGGFAPEFDLLPGTH